MARARDGEVALHPAAHHRGHRAHRVRGRAVVSVAETINRFVQEDAADGYIIVQHLTPHGLDEFVNNVVPELQERGVSRSEYEHNTPRGHLGLRAPATLASGI